MSGKESHIATLVMQRALADRILWFGGQISNKRGVEPNLIGRRLCEGLSKKEGPQELQAKCTICPLALRKER